MKIIVIGCGRMGAGLARDLSLRQHAVTVVDRDPAAFAALGPGFRGRTVEGNGIDRAALRAAGIEGADGLAAVTAGDEANVVAARLALQFFRVPRVVARLYDPRKAEIYRRLGLQTINPVTWGIHRIAELICHSPLSAVASLGSGEVDILEAEVPHLLAGRPADELTVAGEARVVAVSRGGRMFLATGGTVLQAGDFVHIAALGSSLDRLKALLGLR